MPNHKGRELTTITVTQSEIAQNAHGATALVLHTQELDPIAFSLSLEVIEIIRKELNKAEVILRRPRGTA
jgi:hypothetical protein